MTDEAQKLCYSVSQSDLNNRKMSTLTTAQLDSFNKYFAFDPIFSELKKTGINIGFDTLDIRSVAWRVLLGALHGISGDGWLDEMKVQRDKYDRLLKQFESGPIREKNISELTRRSNKNPDPLSIDHSV